MPTTLAPSTRRAPLADFADRRHYLEVLTAIDDAYQAITALRRVAPFDADPMSQALLNIALRRCWARLSGKAFAAPQPVDVPAKLLNRGVIGKPSYRRLQIAAAGGCSAVETMACCRMLILWLASDRDTMMHLEGCCNA